MFQLYVYHEVVRCHSSDALYLVEQGSTGQTKLLGKVDYIESRSADIGFYNLNRFMKDIIVDRTFGKNIYVWFG